MASKDDDPSTVQKPLPSFMQSQGCMDFYLRMRKMKINKVVKAFQNVHVVNIISLNNCTVPHCRETEMSHFTGFHKMLFVNKSIKNIFFLTCKYSGQFSTQPTDYLTYL